MRFRINSQKLAALLASCAITASTLSLPKMALAQEIGLIEQTTPTTLGGPVVTARGAAILEGASSRQSTLTTALAMQLPRDLPQVPSPPAAKGPAASEFPPPSPLDKSSGALGEQSSARNNSRVDARSNIEDGRDAADADEKANDEKDGDSEDRDKKDNDAAAKNSENSLTPLQNRSLMIPVRVVDLSVEGLGTGAIPEAASAKRQVEASSGRLAVQKCVYWHPSSICHYPLRFENAMLERHGHVRFGCLQPLASGARFFATIPAIPYLCTLRSPCEPVYALGNYRPGSCAPLLRDTIPYDQHAAVVEALSLAGFFWAMPL